MLKPFGHSNGSFCNFEEARRLNYDGLVILIDGKRVKSYDDLIQLASQDIYKNMEYIEVVLLQVVEGG